LYFMGRIRDVGELEVYPVEVERRLLDHPAVGVAKALMVSHPKHGNILALMVEPKREYRGKLSEKEIEDWCSRNLPLALRPRLILVKDEMALSSSGKIDVEKVRRELEELLEEKLSSSS
ncbi:MAG: class I adenylate-forming enzyme family protein, partial [Candidatus Jordarchaeales archaeon]